MYHVVHLGFWELFLGWMLPVVFIALVAGILFVAFAGDRPQGPSTGHASRRTQPSSRPLSLHAGTAQPGRVPRADGRPRGPAAR